MKICVPFAAILFIISVFARAASSVWPMPSPLPSTPAGINSAAYPMPRIEWLQRFGENLKNSQPIAANIQLVFDGDSITDAWKGPGIELWNQRYEKFHAFDFGIAGDRTETVLWRLTQGQMKGIQPKLIVLLIGTNNGNNSPAQIAEGVKAIIASYQKCCPEAVILLQAIFPRGELPSDPFRTKISETNRIISQFADGQKVLYIDFGDKFLQPDGTISREIMPDFLHPSSRGYRIWADAIQPTIDRFFPPTATENISFPSAVTADEIRLNWADTPGQASTYYIVDKENSGEVSGPQQGKIAPIDEEGFPMHVGDLGGQPGMLAKYFLLFHLPPLEGKPLTHATLRLFLNQIQHDENDKPLPPLWLFHAGDWQDANWLNDSRFHGLQTFHFSDLETFSKKLQICDETSHAPGFIESDVTEMVLSDYQRNTAPVAAFRLEIGDHESLDISDERGNSYNFWGPGMLGVRDRVPTLVLSYQ